MIDTHHSMPDLSSKPDRARIRKLQRNLTAWYKRNGRDLPWRKTRDPYRIWVSEIMLQQTRVETVLPYYQRFLSRFPTVRDLADAPLEQVLKVWEGLGYYTRARNLHRCAKVIMQQWDGRIPDTEQELTSLPGIGRSTAGAIRTLAFHLPAPILDGNVKRVIARLFAVRGDLTRTAARKRLWNLSALLTPERESHTYTQAVMDLGAMVCTPRVPDCPACPLSGNCKAERLRLQDTIPRPTVRGPLPHYDLAMGIIRRRGRILIQRRPEEGLLGGLWDFPNYRNNTKKGLTETLRLGVKYDFGLEIRTGKEIAAIRHAYTHFQITIHLFECPSSGREREARMEKRYRWVFPAALERYPFPATGRKIIRMIRQDPFGSP